MKKSRRKKEAVAADGGLRTGEARQTGAVQNRAAMTGADAAQSHTAASGTNAVHACLHATANLFAAFGCPGNYYLRDALACDWRLTLDGEIPLLAYRDGDWQNAVVLRQDGAALVYRADGHALVIAIDCVKVAFLLDESREQSECR